MIAGSSLSKLPQIVNIVREQTTAGLSAPMYILEIGTQVVTILYHMKCGNEISVYGENLTLGAGNVAILCLFAWYRRRLGTRI